MTTGPQSQRQKEPRLEPRFCQTGKPCCPHSAWLTSTRRCVRTREGLSHPFAMDAEPTCYPALLSEVPLGGADTTLPIPIPLYGPHCSPGPQGHGASDWLCQTLLFPGFSPPQSLETVSYRRSCHVYCPCRLSHRPRPMGSGAYCGGVGSASRTETWSQLTRLLVSLLLRPQAMLLVPNTFEYSPSVQPHGLPGSRLQSHPTDSLGLWPMPVLVPG